MVAISHVGDVSDNYPLAAFAPDGQTLYIRENNRGDDIRAYSYPALVEQSVVVTDIFGQFACDGDDVLYWFPIAGNAKELWTNAASPTLLASWSSGETVTNLACCWSPYDDHLYVLLVTDSPFADRGLWRVTKAGVKTQIDTSVVSPMTSAGRMLVPTLDGGIWWQSGSGLTRYDIPADTITTNTTVTTQTSDSWIPQPDHSVLAWSTVGGASAGRRATYSAGGSISLALEPDVDVLSPGQRGVAYLPDLSVCTVERHLTAEVWQVGEFAVTARWTLGRVGWGA